MADNLRVVIAAAGQGSRMGSKTNKQFIMLNHKPVIAYSLDFFERHNAVDEIVVVTSARELEYCRDEIIARNKYQKVSAVLAGGQERQDSVWAALQYLARDTDYVAVHDGARPLLSTDVLNRLLEAAEDWGAAIPGVPSRDTVKMINKDSFVRQTLDRSVVYSIQTPQVFKFKELYTAYKYAEEEDFYATDDAALFEKYIGQVKVVEGSYDNIKITTPLDLVFVQTLLNRMD
ncbi:MAG TPA: 2-C-methyl-D-erythritol 4-phosphate cytidylyltransferase [Syntrophomonas sp.]|jgi:2-C-methyl-D-erythritol 4-phosphate cytidylyltransferase|nr:2-C-methyl-D-erythritol 4-phosphate cytidylyltransferase [Syntrophomonas sp.]HRW11697.1 2-C-methyl-D-erythritol 4-phosphate cytidylyltransferase [Syntrophomonas sp.]